MLGWFKAASVCASRWNLRCGPGRRERRRENFDRHVTIELRVARAIDFPHPAAAERRQHGVGTEAHARLQAITRPVGESLGLTGRALQQIHGETVERARAVALSEQRFNFATQIGFGLRQELRTTMRWAILGRVKQCLDLTPAVSGHPVQAPLRA